MTKTLADYTILEHLDGHFGQTAGSIKSLINKLTKAMLEDHKEDYESAVLDLIDIGRAYDRDMDGETEPYELHDDMNRDCNDGFDRTKAPLTDYDSYVKNGFYVYRTAAEVQMAAHKMTNPNLKELPKEPLYDFYLKNGFYAYRTAEELLLAVKRMNGERPPKGYCISPSTQDPVPALGIGGIPLNEGGVYIN